MSDDVNVFTKTEAQSRPQKPAFRVWRMLNTVILLFGVFAPWLTSCNTEITGVGVAKLTVPMLRDFVLGPLDDERVVILLVITFVHIVLIYIILNTVYLIFSTPAKTWLRLTLAFAFGGISIVLLKEIVSIQSFLWGFWLTCGGLLSAAGVEIFDKSKPAPSLKFKRMGTILGFILFVGLIFWLFGYPH